MTGGLIQIGRAARKDVIAAFIHYMWADWVKVMMSDMTPKNIEAWRVAANARFPQLPKEHQNFCREWAEQVLNLMEGIAKDPEFRISETELEIKLEGARKKLGRFYIS